MFIWKRASKITIIADKASLLTATNFNHDWYERPVTFSERVDQTDAGHFPFSHTEVIQIICTKNRLIHSCIMNLSSQILQTEQQESADETVTCCSSLGCNTDCSDLKCPTRKKNNFCLEICKSSACRNNIIVHSRHGYQLEIRETEKLERNPFTRTKIREVFNLLSASCSSVPRYICRIRSLLTIRERRYP